MKYIVSGGNGFIGRRIVDRIRAQGDYVGIYSRKPGTETRHAVQSYLWDTLTGEPPSESLNNYDAVLHLAGEPVAQRWTSEVKRKIRDSRVFGTRRLVDVIGRVQHKPSVLVCASAIGYYGDRGDEVLTESSAGGKGYLADICREWEAEAERATQFGLRVISLRIGFVLGADGGALKTMLPPFRMGLGGPLGSGEQWMPWVHVDDVAAMFLHAAKNDVKGVWNATSPNPVTNADFTKQLAHAVHRPALFTIPRFALKLAYGELGQHMLDSVRVIPQAATQARGQAAFQFEYPQLKAALENLLPGGGAS